MDRGFLFDANQCTGCQACELACTVENNLPWGTSWRTVFTLNPAHRDEGPLFSLSLACNHCAQPACEESCPALALTRSPASGAVLIQEDRCLGCGYCSWACPYDALVFDDRAGVMSKCTACDHRLTSGLAPACVTSCPTGCLTWDELDQTGVQASIEGFTQQPIEPAIRFRPLREDRRVPEMRTWPGEQALLDAWVQDAPDPACPPPNRRRINLASEWPLMVFTLLFAGLVALHAKLMVEGTVRYTAWFLTTTGVAMALSTLHLGQKLRAWRAVLNLRRSWLSREIILYGAFAGLAAAWHLAWPASPVLGWACLLAGVAGLFAVDRVYELPARTCRPGPHSAAILWTGGLFVGLAVGSPALASVVIAWKLWFYLRRGRARWLRPALSALGLLAWVMGTGIVADAGITGIVLAELLDRAEFYRELEFSRPVVSPARRGMSPIAGA